MGKLLLLFTIVPILETYLLFTLGQALGPLPTVLIVVSTGFCGAFLAKREGLRVWQAWQEALGKGQMPEDGITGGVLVLIGGVLLVTPGVMTDVVGLSLLIPPSRRFIAKYVRRALKKRFDTGQITTEVNVGGINMGSVDVGGAMGSFFGEGPEAGAGQPDVFEAESEVIEERRPGSDHPTLH